MYHKCGYKQSTFVASSLSDFPLLTVSQVTAFADRTIADLFGAPLLHHFAVPFVSFCCTILLHHCCTIFAVPFCCTILLYHFCCTVDRTIAADAFDDRTIGPF